MQNLLSKEKNRKSDYLTGFELTQNVLKRLNEFDLTISSKLVLVFLTTFYNVQKNGAVVFPSIQHIADTLGIGQTATKQAIKDLILNGLILKTKQNKLGNHNKYILSLKVQNPTVKQSENDFFKQPKSDLFMNRTNNNEQIKEQTTNVVVFKKKQITFNDVPTFILSNKNIKNPCAYWASLDDEVKKELLQKENEKRIELLKNQTEKQLEEIRKQEEKEEYTKLKNTPLGEKYSKEQAISLINSMPPEVKKISKLANDLKNLYKLD